MDIWVVDGHLGCLYFLVIVKHAATDMGVKLSESLPETIFEIVLKHIWRWNSWIIW